MSIVNSPIVKESSLHRSLPIERHGYTWPFVFVYGPWLYVYFTDYDRFLGNREFSMFTLILLGAAHALSFLSCQWSVSIKAFMTCKKVMDSPDSSNGMFIDGIQSGKRPFQSQPYQNHSRSSPRRRCALRNPTAGD
jgi:hypothetical protein